MIKKLSGSNCPKCGSDYVARSHRSAVQRLLSVGRIFPYRCDACGARFMLLGETRQHRVEGEHRSDTESKRIGQR